MTLTENMNVHQYEIKNFGEKLVELCNELEGKKKRIDKLYNDIEDLEMTNKELMAVVEAAKNLTKEGEGDGELDYWDGRVFGLHNLETKLKALESDEP